MALHSVAAVRRLLRINTNYAEPLVFIVRHHRANRMTYKAVLDSEGNRIDNRNKFSPLREEVRKAEFLTKAESDVEPDMRQPRKKVIIKPNKPFTDRAATTTTVVEHGRPGAATTMRHSKPATSEQKKPSRVTSGTATSNWNGRTTVPSREHVVNQRVKPVFPKAQEQVNEELKEEEEEEEELVSGKFFIPRYTKIHAWDKSNEHVKLLGKMLSSKRERQESSLVVVEGTRIINDALRAGLKPDVLVFSRVKLLRGLNLDPEGTDYDCYHVPYNNIKLWSDLTTPTGIMAAFSKDRLRQALRQRPAAGRTTLGLSLVCDSVRSPDNLGAVIRAAAAAGARQVVLTRGCVEAWSPKVVRAAAGAHFQVPLVEGVGWEVLENYLEPYPQVVLADLVHNQDSGIMSVKEREAALEQL